jgi:Domain of unknown function (DUF4124)
MHPRQSWLALSLLTALSVQAAVIYRWVDTDGVVHYSDQESPGSERIVTSAPNTSAAGPRGAPAASAQAARRPANGSLDYTEITISSPQTDQTFFGNDPIAVHLNLNPGLKAGHSVAWHLNGKQLDDQKDAVSFSIARLDRGTYSVMATITDQQTGESQNSNSVTFFVRQASALSPQSPLHK